jgi:hypothetical protein
VDVLNGSAALMWLQFEDGPSTTDKIAEHLARLYGLAPSEVFPAIVDILEKWKVDGWLSQCQDGSWSISQMPSEDAQERDQLHSCMSIPDCDDRILFWQRRLAIYDGVVLLSVWGMAEQALSDDIERLRGFLSGIPEAFPTNDLEEISLIFGKSGVAVKTLQNTFEFRDYVEASATLNSLLIHAAARGPHTFTTLHAAAVSREQGSILMPAVSGSGKTTLTACLVQRGWRYGGDDIVGVGRSGNAGLLKLEPFPTAMGIKDGSVSVLEADYPHIHRVTSVKCCKFRGGQPPLRLGRRRF